MLPQSPQVMSGTGDVRALQEEEVCGVTNQGPGGNPHPTMAGYGRNRRQSSVWLVESRPDFCRANSNRETRQDGRMGHEVEKTTREAKPIAMQGAEFVSVSFPLLFPLPLRKKKENKRGDPAIERCLA